jgi:hypothetical protein
MAMMESWFGDALERKYVSSITFDGIHFHISGGPDLEDPNYWTDEHDIKFPSAAWKSLDLVDLADTFYMRILCSGTEVAQVSICSVCTNGSSGIKSSSIENHSLTSLGINPSWEFVSRSFMNRKPFIRMRLKIPPGKTTFNFLTRIPLPHA